MKTALLVHDTNADPTDLVIRTPRMVPLSSFIKGAEVFYIDKLITYPRGEEERIGEWVRRVGFTETFLALKDMQEVNLHPSCYDLKKSMGRPLLKGERLTLEFQR